MKESRYLTMLNLKTCVLLQYKKLIKKHFFQFCAQYYLMNHAHVCYFQLKH